MVNEKYIIPNLLELNVLPFSSATSFHSSINVYASFAILFYDAELRLLMMDEEE